MSPIIYPHIKKKSFFSSKNQRNQQKEPHPTFTPNFKTQNFQTI